LLTTAYKINEVLQYQLQQTLQQMTTALKQHRKAEIATPLVQLATEQKQLEALLKAQGDRS
jgi:hypothetical protein